jgi:iron(III) transport system ATP-binding protein
MTLATRIAVMFEGRLQQIGTPTEIYDRPANRFVAEFLGNPPMNIVELDAEGPGAQARRAAARYVAGTSAATEVRSIGFRPEAVRILDSAPLRAGFVLEAGISALLPTGGSWIIEAICDGRRFFAVTIDKPDLSVGQQVFLFADAADTHAFDRDGRRVHALDVADMRTR